MNSIVKMLRPVFPFVRYGVIILALVVAVPPVSQYWLSHVRVPEVPISAIVAMFAASLLLLSFAATMYVVILTMQNMMSVQMGRGRRGGFGGRGLGSPPVEPTGGSFTPSNDRDQWAVEQYNHLKKMGMINESDTADIEERIREIATGAKSAGKSNL